MRKTLFKWHSKLALLAMLPLLLICLTGSILVFKPELDRALMPEQAQLTGVSGERQSLDRLHQLVLSQLPNYHIGTWELFDDQQQPDRVYLIGKGSDRWSMVFVDPYRGELLSSPVGLNHYFTDWLVELHYTFLLGVNGTFAAFIFALLLLFLGISGLVLHRHFWRKLLTLRWDKTMTVMFSDVHKLVGIWSAPVLLVLGFTGGYWNMAHVIEEASHDHHHISQPEVLNPLISLDELNVQAQKQIAGFKATYIVMPFEQGKQLSFYGKVPSSNPINSDYGSGVSYSPQTGELVQQWDIRTTSLLAVVLDSFRTLHFGTFAGFFSRVVWAIVGVMPLLLSISGFWLWYQRKQKRQVAQLKRLNLSLV
jgi:uncharacterized iron-regulated membrane protein